MMAGSESRSVRSERRSALHRLGEEIANLKNPQLDESDLEKLNIKTQKINLDEKSNLDPCFFQPYQGPLPIPDDREMEKEWSSYEEGSETDDFQSSDIDHALGFYLYFRIYLSFCGESLHEQNQPHGPWDYKQLGDYRFKGPLYGVGKSRWRLVDVFYIPGQQYPHLSGMILHDTNKEHRLLRGELQAIITMMIQRLRSVRFSDHTIAPVMLFSFMGPQHGRMLQAYFDGTRLVIRYSNLYNFERKDIPSLQLFARWALSQPVGVTQPAGVTQA